MQHQTRTLRCNSKPNCKMANAAKLFCTERGLHSGMVAIRTKLHQAALFHGMRKGRWQIARFVLQMQGQYARPAAQEFRKHARVTAVPPFHFNVNSFEGTRNARKLLHLLWSSNLWSESTSSSMFVVGSKVAKKPMHPSVKRAVSIRSVLTQFVVHQAHGHKCKLGFEFFALLCVAAECDLCRSTTFQLLPRLQQC